MALLLITRLLRKSQQISVNSESYKIFRGFCSPVTLAPGRAKSLMFYRLVGTFGVSDIWNEHITFSIIIIDYEVLFVSFQSGILAF